MTACLTSVAGDLRRDVDRAARELDGAPALEVIGWAVELLGANVVVASSMQDAVLPHLVSRVLPGVDVLFLDTGYHFEQSLSTRDAVARSLPLTVVNARPRQTVAEQDADYGPALYETDPNLCCFLRKVEPLARGLEQYDGWFSGLRRTEASTRAGAPVIGWDDGHDLVKINPIATWTDEDVEAYQVEHGLPRNPLRAQGYPSIGCAPCTRRVAPGEDARAGRWSGRAKTECGIHV